MSDSDDDRPQLSAGTLAALQEFRAQQGQVLLPVDKFAVGAIEEDWRMSQFWYTEETATQLAKEAIREAGENGRIACISAPSVYQKLRQLNAESPLGVSAVVLEYDRRFAAYGDEFIFYDYNNPLFLPEEIGPQSFDIVIADPPYLSEECLRKVAITVKYLTKGKILLSTGAVMEEQAGKLLGVKICHFLPKHDNKLANEFRCYANYDTRL